MEGGVGNYYVAVERERLTSRAPSSDFIFVEVTASDKIVGESSGGMTW
jgi:hypothetical protein